MKEEFEEVKVSDLGINISDTGDPLLKPLEADAIYQKCRACTQHLFDVKHNLLESSELIELFRRLSSTELHSDDRLPKSICRECFQHLKDFEMFQEKCVSSYTILLEYSTKTLKHDPFCTDPVPVDPIHELKSIPTNLLEFEEVVVSNIKIEQQNVEDETEGRIETKDIKNTSEDIEPSPRKPKIRRQPVNRKAQAESSRKKVDESREEHGFQLYKCERCDSTFDSEMHYKGHLRKHEGKKPYPCHLCTREYEKITLYEQHMEIEHSGDEPPKYECTVDGCGKRYRTQPALNKHMNRHSNISPRERKRVVCETCGKYILACNIKQHAMMHKGLAPYLCDQCPKKFASSIKLERHKLIHLNIKPHTCQLCGLKMRSQKDVDWHMRLHNRKRKYPCELCDKSFYTRDNLRRHVTGVHYNIKNFHCTYCDQSFTQSTSLKCHLMLHTGERPFKCPHCEKSFIQKCKLRIHVKNQHKDKPPLPIDGISADVDDATKEIENNSSEYGQDFRNFECEICGEKTTFKERRGHMAQHNREKRYLCHICSMDFITNRVLLNHIKVVHDGVKPYACQYCDKSFGKRTTLRNHTMRHTGERPLQCVHCEKPFITRFALQYHEKKREKDIALGKVPCSKDAPVNEGKGKRKRRKKTSNKILIVAPPMNQLEMPQSNMPESHILPATMPQTSIPPMDMPQSDGHLTVSYNQDETLLVL